MKTNLLFILLLLTSLTTRSQIISLEGGINRSTINRTNLPSDGSLHNGAAFGLGMQYDLNNRFALVGRLLYESKGMKLKGVMTDITAMPIGYYELDYTLNYLSIPLMLRIGFGEKVRFFINAGPSFSYLMRATYSADIPGYSLDDTKINVTKQFRRMDINLIIGLGLQFRLSDPLFISCEARACSGIMDISTGQVGDYNATLQGLIGVGWKL